MKKTLLTTLALGAVATLATSAFGAALDINGSGHDFRGDTWYDNAMTSFTTTTDQICTPCHAPHNNQNLDGTLLWNHDMQTTAQNAYTLYDSNTFDGTVVAANTIGDESYVCLSCHDGTVALGAFNASTVAGGTISAEVGSNVVVGAGGNMSQDHPISFTWNAADAELAPVTTLYGNSTIAGYLIGGTVMECSTCHDVHNTGLPTTRKKLLVEDNTASAMCQACHLK